MFKSPESLARIYPTLVRSGISVFGSQDVMRFLGKKPHGNFQGEVVSHYGHRVEGIRLKHRLKANSVKAYDKQGSILRIETTLNNVRDLKVYRPKQGDPEGPCSWQRMRKGVADLHRRGHSFLKHPINGIWTLLLLSRWTVCWEKSLNRFAALFIGKVKGFAPFARGTKKKHVFFR